MARSLARFLGFSQDRASLRAVIYYRALKSFREMGISLVACVTADPDTADMGFPSDFRIEMDESNPYYQLPIVDMSDADKISQSGEAF